MHQEDAHEPIGSGLSPDRIRIDRINDLLRAARHDRRPPAAVIDRIAEIIGDRASNGSQNVA